MLYEMQTTSFRIWTWITVSISYNDYYYTTFAYIKWGVVNVKWKLNFFSLFYKGNLGTWWVAVTFYFLFVVSLVCFFFFLQWMKYFFFTLISSFYFLFQNSFDMYKCISEETFHEFLKTMFQISRYVLLLNTIENTSWLRVCIFTHLSYWLVELIDVLS